MVTILTKNLLKNKSMKKLILLLVIAFGLFGCSNDDENSTSNPPFKGHWKVDYILYGDEDLSERTTYEQNTHIPELSEFHFSEETFTLVNSGEIVFQGTYSYETVSENSAVYYIITFTYNDAEINFYISNCTAQTMNLSTGGPSLIYLLRV